MIPKRKDNAGKEIDLVAILQAVENSPLKQLESSVKSKDKVAFEKAYRFMLDGCYSCHKAADRRLCAPRFRRGRKLRCSISTRRQFGRNDRRRLSVAVSGKALWANST